MTGLISTELKSLKKIYAGKVRELYEVDEKRMLMIATDRLSAFDVILAEPIPDKGKILTAISHFWFTRFRDLVPHHCTDDVPESVVGKEDWPQIEGRSMVVKRLRPIPVEAVVRGYLTGSAWNTYQKSRMVGETVLPEGLLEAEILPQPIFTPSTKAPIGQHDEPLSLKDYEAITGPELAIKIRDTSLLLYEQATVFARTRGILIADTKFEFGLDENGTLCLMDEVLTPDSSRFWPADPYMPGRSPPSYDKQFVRDWLESTGWNKVLPAPALPKEVIEKTARKYQEVLERLCKD